MISLIVICIIGLVISSYKINKRCEAEKESFNPYNGSVLEAFVWLLTAAILITLSIAAIACFLP